MKWRVMVELAGSDGAVLTHEISTGGSNTAECSAATVRTEPGRRKTDPRRVGGSPRSGAGRGILRQRRVCSHCRSHRPLKDVRTRRLSSLSGTVEIRAPRFLPCRCAVTHPVAEIMPDRCRRNTSVSSQGWGLCFRTAGPGHCCRNFCRSATYLRWRQLAGGP
jgi:hypothetical protein